MEKKEPISMGKLGNFTLKKSKEYVIIAFLVTLSFATAYAAIFLFNSTIWDKNNTVPAQTITLEDVVIAYAPETRTIVFLDRESGKVKFSLSDSVSLAVFALKSSEAVMEYSSSVTPKK